VNQAPSFTSAAAAGVREGVLAAYQAAAQDPEGASLAFSISGGEDAARFTISATGALSFVAAPDFEAPADANRDNVYLVQIAVSDGQLTTTLALQVTVTDDGLLLVKRIAAGLAEPRYVAAIPGDRRVFVIERGGRILLLDPATGGTELFINAANVLDPISGNPRRAISTDGDARGLLGLAASPDFQSSGVVYGAITNPAGDLEIRRFSRAANNPNQFAAITVMTIPHPASDINYGGWIGFGPDGHLYIATGDGGGSYDPKGNAQNRNTRLGKILRAMPNSDPFAGGAPNYALQPVAGNPFIGSGDPFVYALGFHDPRRASFYAGGLLIGDRGERLAEEIDLLRPQDAAGNYGWPFREGTFVANSGGPAALIDPVAQYGRGDVATSVIGGYVYRGPAAVLAGQYVFGDSGSGNIWTIPTASLQQGRTVTLDSFTRRNPELVPDAGRIDRLVSFGEDHAGNLYIVDGDGEIFIILPS
jgi:glucose/arabinose dehydrogenase